MTVILVGRYRKNKNATSIAYKTYAQTIEDIYPTFTLCLKGDGLYHYNGSAIFQAYGLNPRNYEQMLEGKPAFRYHYDTNLGLYNMTPLSLGYTTDFTFDDMVQNSTDISTLVKKAHFEAAETDRSTFYGIKEHYIEDSSNVAIAPFYISYQTSKRMCFTRESRDNLDSVRVRDNLYLDMSLIESTVIVEMFFHYPGQLLRNLDSPSFTSDSHYIQGKGVQFKHFQSTKLMKRPVKESPCMEGIMNYDLYVREAVSNKLGCIPPTWMHGLKAISSLNECISPQKSRNRAHISS